MPRGWTHLAPRDGVKARTLTSSFLAVSCRMNLYPMRSAVDLISTISSPSLSSTDLDLPMGALLMKVPLVD